jgi:uncharacterized protein (DUF1501 family)
MNRRKFIKYSGLTSTAALVPGFIQALVSPLNQLTFQGKRIVIIQLSGGNDGLNALVPFRNDIYYKSRPKLGLKPLSLLKISDEAGFHPALGGFKKLFDEGYLGIYNAVGYPNPDRSHFRSMDIWHTASNADEYFNTGWIGRLLDANCPGSEKPYYAIEADDTLSLAMKGANKSGFAVRNPEKLRNELKDPIYNQIQKSNSNEDEQSQLSFLYKTLAETSSSAEYIYSKSKIYHSSKTYPEHEFGKSLKEIAELINSGLESKVFYTSISGFDTHVRQLETQNRLFSIVGNSIETFVSDLKASNNFNDTVIMVFSEFGRRVKQNASGGTDHGTANNVYLINGALNNKGIYNPMADLSSLADGDLVHQIDFRKIYATLIEKVIGFNHEAALNRKFELLDFI